MARNNKLLVVEDDLGLQSQIKWCFENYDVILASDRDSAIEQIRKHKPPVVTLDLGLPPHPDDPSEGLATLEEILRVEPNTKVVVVTGQDEKENAVKAIGLGAYDFYTKPFEPEIIGLIVNRAYRLMELEQENQRLLQGTIQEPFDGVIACSPQMQTVCKAVEKVAPSDATVLLLGESGTGKELAARALHNLGQNKAGRFIAINCAAIPDTLLESELFGYEKGAFTGANKQTKGKIEHAHGGTLFLDEMGDLPLSLQAKLLRFLQERVIERVGGHEPIAVNTRVVCATHQNLRQRIENGEFREDLFYRISEIPLEIPPLREREGDVIVLARFFFEKFNEDHGRKLRGFNKEALAAMESYGWPGNVRELQNRIKRAVIMADGKQLTAADLELDKTSVENMNFNLRELREKVERQAIMRALSHVDGKVAPAAELLGVSRPTLYDLIKKLNITA
ncbi:MAG: PEP-CTERM-box response regulator transcription factor [Gammaproteobacteria bacterium]|jgi:two-component system NtrC family response regulator|nr:PEP-CTERM-box response regulator transcription factor [Gammaproteobacteria bacterium]